VVIKFSQNPQRAFKIKWLSLINIPEIWSDKAHPRFSEPENLKYLKYLKYLILSLSSLYRTKILKISNNPISSEQPHPTVSQHILDYKVPTNHLIQASQSSPVA
jgi:hypothetical protein